MKRLDGSLWKSSGIKNLILALLIPAGGLSAQDAPVSASPASSETATAPVPPVTFRTTVDPRPDATSIHESVSANYSYVDGSTTKTGSGSFGKLNEQESNVSTDFRIPINETFSVILRAGYKRFDFGGLNSQSSTPQNLQSLETGVGLGYKVDPNWQVFGVFSPTIQEVNNSGNSTYIHYGGVLAANDHWNDDLSFGFGLAINPGGLNQIPVLPVASVRWHFADQWTLNVGVPRSSLDYALTKQIDLWAGPSFEGGEYRTSSSYGNPSGNPALDRQKFEYQEVRFGSGIDYKIHPAITLTGEVGAALYRDFYFRDASDYRPHSDPAPYAEIGLRFRF